MAEKLSIFYHGKLETKHIINDGYLFVIDYLMFISPLGFTLLTNYLPLQLWSCFLPLYNLLECIKTSYTDLFLVLTNNVNIVLNIKAIIVVKVIK